VIDVIGGVALAAISIRAASYCRDRALRGTTPDCEKLSQISLQTN